MRVEYICPKCLVSVLAPESLSGAAAPCPACGREVRRWPPPVQVVERAAPGVRAESEADPEPEPEPEPYIPRRRRKSRGPSKAVKILAVVNVVLLVAAVVLISAIRRHYDRVDAIKAKSGTPAAVR